MRVKRIKENSRGVILLLTMFILTGILVVTLGAAEVTTKIPVKINIVKSKITAV